MPLGGTGVGLELVPFVEDQVWLRSYPVHYFGMDLRARTTVLRLDRERLVLHSPGPMEGALVDAIRGLGQVAGIIAPGSFHWIHVPAAQEAFPDAEVHVCPGVEKRLPGLRPDGVLGETAPPLWAGILDQVPVLTPRWMQEVVFLHRPTRTLVLTDLVEWVGDQTPDVPRMLRFWWAVFRMWNRPRPAPEYQLGWGPRAAVRQQLDRILAWQAERAVLAHGDLIVSDVEARLRDAWAGVSGR